VHQQGLSKCWMLVARGLAVCCFYGLAGYRWLDGIARQCSRSWHALWPACAATVVVITHASTCVDSDSLGARFTSSSSLAFYASRLVCMPHHTPPTAVTAYRPAGTLPRIYTFTPCLCDFTHLICGGITRVSALTNFPAAAAASADDMHRSKLLLSSPSAWHPSSNWSLC
jgi:hypothetical protein